MLQSRTYARGIADLQPREFLSSYRLGPMCGSQSMVTPGPPWHFVRTGFIVGTYCPVLGPVLTIGRRREDTKNRAILRMCFFRQISYHVRVHDGLWGDVGHSISEKRSAKLKNSVPRTCTGCPILNIAPPIDGARRPQKTFRPKTQQEQIGILPENYFMRKPCALYNTYT